MRNIINIFLLSIIITLYTSNIHAMNINIKKNNKIDTESFDDVQRLKEIEKNPDADNFYLIFVNYTLIANKNEKGHNKRHEENREEFINSLMDDIHDLIVDNIDTYENPDSVEEIISQEKLRKRDDQEYFGIVNNISSLGDISVLTALLTLNLTETVKEINGVYACIPNRPFKFQHFNKQDIIKETKWNNLVMRNNSDIHLSLISQGKYNPNLISKYDNTYYYPEKAGQNSKIIIIDEAFNFYHEEFSNTNRYTECVIGYGYDGQPRKVQDSKKCNIDYTISFTHGSVTADIAGGLKHGVAPNADIYGFPVNHAVNFITLIRVLDYIGFNLLYNGNNRLVFSMSFGDYYPEGAYPEFFEYLQYVINLYHDYGTVFVASAGNYNQDIYNTTTEEKFYPCHLNNVICVGATENPYNITSNDSNKKLINSYRKAEYSNYGDNVNIYAPGYHNYAITNFDKENNKEEGLFKGTSGSAPIVAGVVATIMSEHPEINFNYDSMLKYLQNISIKNAIEDIEKDHPSNYFINNGKHIVYSEDDVYYGCGINAGNNECESNYCCSSEGYCVNDDDLCKIENGCQSNYGFCNA